MTDSRKPAPPKGLGKRGRALWRDLHDQLEYDAHESTIVLEACRTVDAIDNLQAVIDRDGYTIAGSTGQTVVHPAVAELRQQQAGLTRLLTALNLSAALEGQAGAVALSRAVSAQATAAANARWSRSKGARGA
ncbi:hypothetical protein F6B41_02780 [Microbacterium lushaniae]|nr:hypothetical protein F6B41_13265 [Microbacterium lushaniae]KAA9158830.1 hypothetical protein F6B41_02780 [Microbacterium lushaniae]